MRCWWIFVSLCSQPPIPNPCGGGRIWWHWNAFLVVRAHSLTVISCNRSRASCTLLRNGIQNRRAAFWLANAQLTLHGVALQQDAKSHEIHRAAIWLAYSKTRMLKPRKRSTVTRPFSSPRVGSGDRTRFLYDPHYNAKLLSSAKP